MTPVLVTAIAACFLLVSPGAHGARGQDVCVETTHESGCRVEPKRITIGASSDVRSLDWKSWGGSEAIGIGILRSPTIDDEKAKIKLYRLATCGKTWYSRATVRYGESFENTHIQGYRFTVC